MRYVITLMLFAATMQLGAQTVLNPKRLAYYRDGEPRPDANFYGYDGHHYDFTEILDQGQIIFVMKYSGSIFLIDTILQNGLQEFYDLHGPNGDNRVLLLILAGATNLDGDTLPNEVINLNIPIINLNEGAGWVESQNMNRWGWLTRYAPNRKMHQFMLGEWYTTTFSGPGTFVPTLAELEADLAQLELATDPVDAAIIWSNTSERPNLINQLRPMDAFLCNMSTSPMYTAQIEAWWGDSLVKTQNWEGFILPYHHDTIAMGDLMTDGMDKALTFVVKNPNGIADVDPSNDTFSIAIPKGLPSIAFDTLTVEIRTSSPGLGLYWDAHTNDGLKVMGTICDFDLDEYYPNSQSCACAYSSLGWGYPAMDTIFQTLILPSDADWFTIRGVANKSTGYTSKNGYLASVRFWHGDSLLFKLDTFAYERCFVFRVENDELNPVGVEQPIGVQPGKDVVENATNSTVEESEVTWQLYPNPANATIYLSASKPSGTLQNVLITNDLGQVLSNSARVQGLFELDVSTFAEGHYILQATTPNGKSIQFRFEVLH